MVTHDIENGRNRSNQLSPNTDDNAMQFAPKHLTKQEFGRRLYRLMIAKGWTQSELARHADLPRDSVSTYVRGKTLPTPLSVQKLSAALDVSPDILLPNHIESAIDADNPDLEIRSSAGIPNKSWLRVNRLVSTKVALQIAELLENDNAAHAGRGGSDPALFAGNDKAASE